MTEPKDGQSGRTGQQQAPADTARPSDDDFSGESERKAFSIVIDSLLRICTNAQNIIDRDERWQVGKKASANEVMDVVFDSVRDCEQEYRRWRAAAPKKGEGPHPLGAVAELLVAKTIATFGGTEAVQDLSKWTRKAEAKLSGDPSP